jgi:ABC-2 type transport system permease protein
MILLGLNRVWRIYKTFFLSSLQREMEFRANFVAKLLQNGTWIFFYILIVLVIFSQTKEIAGWNRERVFVLVSTISLVTSIHSALFFSCFEIPEQIRKGTLDFVITKPVDAMYWVSVRRFNITSFGTITASLIMMGVGLAQAGMVPTWDSWLAYVILGVFSLAMVYSLGMILMTTSIYFVRVDNLWVLAETAIETARYPVDIYRTTIPLLFTLYIPLGLLASVPARTLFEGPNWLHVGVAGIWAVVFLAASRWFWIFSLSRYTSSSS